MVLFASKTAPGIESPLPEKDPVSQMPASISGLRMRLGARLVLLMSGLPKETTLSTNPVGATRAIKSCPAVPLPSKAVVPIEKLPSGTIPAVHPLPNVSTVNTWFIA